MSAVVTNSTDDDAAWEREMEMAIEGRGRTRSRSILATHTDDDDETNDTNDNDGDAQPYDRRGGRGGRGAGDALEPLDTSGTPRGKSNSVERPAGMDIVDGGHDPNWLNSPASSDGGGDNFTRGRARSFTAKRTMEMEQDSHQQQQLQHAANSSSSRRRSRSFSSLNQHHGGRQQDGDEETSSSQDEMDQIVRRATSLSKIYLVGSAPVDISKLQDESKIVGVKKVEVVEPTGALSSKALDALSEGLQSLSVDGSAASSALMMMPTTGAKNSSSSLISEAELEERRMAEEEDQKLKIQKLSTRKTLSERASFFKAKVFKTATGGGKSSNSPQQQQINGSSSSSSSSNKTTKTANATTAASATTTTGSSGSSGTGATTTSAPTTTTSDASSSAASSAVAAPVVIKRHKLKLLLLGDSGVGKTSLMRVFSGDEFSESMLATAGVDFKLRNIAVGDDEIALQIWDTAGQERFHRITATYYKGANGIVLVYDVSDRKSFDNVGYWMNNIRQYASPNMPAMLLVGNKIDLPNRVVSSEEGLATAKQYNVRYIETSAKTSENTNGALESIARDAFFISVNPTMTQKTLMEKEKSLLGRRNKENCVIS